MDKYMLMQVRVKNGYTQKDFSEKLGVSQPWLSLMENGLRPISPKTASKVISQFEITSEMFDRVEQLRRVSAT